MPDELHIHPATKNILESYLNQPPHAMLLVGPRGIGKYTLATKWASELTDQQPQILKPDEKGTISIGSVRDLYRSSRSRQEKNQVIIIDHAETMSKEAENALLKLLEEPNKKITFILTAPKKEALLQTITSRTQIVNVYQISNQILKNNLDLPEKDINQILFISNGRPGILNKLASNPERFQKERQFMQEAKALLSESKYQRLIYINKLTKDRNDCISVISAMLQMVSIQIKHSHKEKLRSLIRLEESLEQALTRIQANGNIKIQLLKLFTNY